MCELLGFWWFEHARRDCDWSYAGNVGAGPVPFYVVYMILPVVLIYCSAWVIRSNVKSEDESGRRSISPQDLTD